MIKRSVISGIAVCSFGLASFLVVACGGDDEVGSNEETAQTGPKDLVVTGTLQISANITPPEGVTAGVPRPGAVVFVAGSPETTAETNESGEFEIKIDRSEADQTASLAETEANYTLMAWYTKAGEDYGDLSQFRVGKAVDFASDLSKTSAELGTIDLVYTNGIHMTVQNADSEALLEGCTIALDGLGSHVIVKEKSAGKYDVDYLPEDTYTITTKCDGYQDKTTEFFVREGKNLDDWVSLTVEMSESTE